MAKKIKAQHHNMQFLSGGGEMGQLTRDYDWSRTSLGTPDTWPQSLRTTLSILLNSKFPMFLWWGPELICFYNDAYRPSLGQNGKHPDILGMQADKAWAEIWHVLKPLIDQVLGGGEATWAEDQLIPIFRNGRIEDVYWTFSYSPVNDESGRPAGVFVACAETTEKVNTFKKLEESNKRFLNNIMQAPVAMCVFRGSDYVVEIANKPMLELWGKTAQQIINKPIFEGLPEARGQGLEALLDGVYTTGERFTASERPVNLPRNGKIESTYINFVYEALMEPDGTITGIIATASEVTSQVIARRSVEDSQKQLEFAIEAGEMGTFDYDPKYNTFYANARYRDWLGMPAQGPIDLALAMTAVAEEDRADVEAALQRSFDPAYGGHFDIEFGITNILTGISRLVHAKGKTTFNDKGEPFRFNGTVQDVTEQAHIRKTIEESEERFRTMAEGSDILIAVADETSNAIYFNKAWTDLTGRSMADLINYGWADLIHPEDRERYVNIYLDAFHQKAAFTGEFRVLNKQGAYTWLLAQGPPRFRADGSFAGYISASIDITDRKKIENELKANEQKFRSLVEIAPFALAVYVGEEMRIELANQTIIDIWGKGNDVVGKLFSEVLPELESQHVFEQIREVYRTGEAFHIKNQHLDLVIDGKSRVHYFNYSFNPVIDSEGKVFGVMNTGVDLTELNLAKQRIEESEQRFRNNVKQAPIGIAVFRGANFVVESANEAYLQIVDRREKDFVGKPLFEGLPEVKDIVEPLLTGVFNTGVPFYATDFPVPIHRFGHDEITYFNFVYQPLKETNGDISGIMVVATDVTASAKAKLQLEEAEARLRLATEATGLSTWDLDLQTRAIIHSPRLAEIFGHTASAKITHPGLRSQIHPDDLNIVESAFDLAMETGIYQYEARVVKPNKEVCWIHTRGKVVYDEGNKPIKMLGTLTDITEEKYHEQQLLEREQKFRLLADSMPQQIWTGDADGNLTYFNRSVYQYSGLTQEDIDKDGWLQIVHPDDRDNNISTWMNAITSGNDFLFEHRFRRHDGEYRWQLSRAIPQRDASGKIQMWVGTSTDVHDQKTFTTELERQVEERTSELMEKNNELEKMNTELKSFTYISSHDLQEPLRKIQIFAQRLIDKEQEKLTDDGRNYLSKMHDAATRMRKLIDDLLAYSHISNAEQAMESMDINLLITEVTDELKEAIQEKQATIKVDEMRKIKIIPFQMHQLFHNLISNSLKFASDQHPLHIEIRSEVILGSKLPDLKLSPQKNYCHITYQDNGIGFDQEHKEKIFQVFQRLDHTGKYEGTGIGLAIVKKIVENHNGAITAEGEPNKGATFNIYLPV